MTPKQKIDKASEATRHATETCFSVRDRLNGFLLNQHHIPVYPQGLKRSIMTAIEDLTGAYKMLDEVEWPTPEDYDEE